LFPHATISFKKSLLNIFLMLNNKNVDHFSRDEPFIYSDHIEFPGFSFYSRRDYHLFKVSFVDGVQGFFLNSCHFKPLIPLLCLTIVIMNFFYCIWYLLPKYPTDRVNLFVFPLVLSILFSLSYIKCIIDGPGYFPFYWGSDVYQSTNQKRKQMLQCLNMIIVK